VKSLAVFANNWRDAAVAMRAVGSHDVHQYEV